MTLFSPTRRKMGYYERTGVFAAILELAERGHTQSEIADELNRRGLRTQRGRLFNQPGISLLVSQAQEAGKLPLTVEV